MHRSICLPRCLFIPALLLVGTSLASAEQDTLYSGAGLTDAAVYTQGQDSHKIGRVQDVLLDKNLRLKSFIIEAREDSQFGSLNTRSYAVAPDQLAVITRSKDRQHQPEYRVKLDMSTEELSQQPVYKASWVANAQSKSLDAWQETKKSANTAWRRIKHAADHMMEKQNQTDDDAPRKQR